MVKRPEAAWVVFDPDGPSTKISLLCKRCGGRDAIDLPAGMNVVASWMDAVIKQHSRCLPAEEKTDV